ncbi:uncharacterized protein LOC132293543 [Cornus florida]|uniref:uncharacterized protein LOC132293543 n=1 Tax=Cornus florida TaxID=4283 RepID=UPI00289D439B|nr:uncharacterized protein LOC132293543 [Cornus florida]XP_059647058.1 uncharacterized protein LOC132293543 [Cornus florida]
MVSSDDGNDGMGQVRAKRKAMELNKEGPTGRVFAEMAPSSDGNDGMLQVRAKSKAMELNKEGPTVGIHFGTTSCSLAVIEGNVATIAASLPCYVSFTDSGPLIGDAAKELFPMNRENTITGPLRFVGYTASALHSKLPAPIGVHMIEDLHEDDAPWINVTIKGVEKHLSPEAVSSLIIEEIKKTAEKSLGVCIVDVACALPNKLENRNARVDGIQNAIAFADLRLAGTHTEVTAVVSAYGYEKEIRNPVIKNVLIVDVGGTASNVTLFSVGQDRLEYEETTTDDKICGERMDMNMALHIRDEFNKRHRGVHANMAVINRLLIPCEKAKISLSSNDLVEVEVKQLLDGVDYSTSFTRPKFEELNGYLFVSLVKMIRCYLRKFAKDKYGRLHEIVLVGGCSNIPKLREVVQAQFESKLQIRLKPEYVVACGVAIRHAQEKEKEKEKEKAKAKAAEHQEVTGDDISCGMALISAYEKDDAPVTLGRFKALERDLKAIQDDVTWIKERLQKGG